jgi:hypothetical protein
MDKKQRTIQQNKSIHRGCTDIANTLVEHGQNLAIVIQRLDVRPTMESVKDIFRAIAKSKYGVESTTELTTAQINPIWEELTKAVSEATGVYVNFPSQETTQEYLQSYEQ